MVYLQNLHDRHRRDGLFVYAIAMHPDPDEARKLTIMMGVTYPVFLGSGSELGIRFAYG